MHAYVVVWTMHATKLPRHSGGADSLSLYLWVFSCAAIMHSTPCCSVAHTLSLSLARWSHASIGSERAFGCIREQYVHTSLAVSVSPNKPRIHRPQHVHALPEYPIPPKKAKKKQAGRLSLAALIVDRNIESNGHSQTTHSWSILIPFRYHLHVPFGSFR